MQTQSVAVLERTAPTPNMLRVAACVARRLAVGEEDSYAIKVTAEALRISRAAVAHCVMEVAAYLDDPYLESDEAQGLTS